MRRRGVVRGGVHLYPPPFHMLLPLVLPLFFLIACDYAGGVALAAGLAMNCTIPCGDSTVKEVSKRMVEEGLIDAKTEQFCPPFVDADPARDLTVYALGADREMALQWTHKLKSLDFKLDHLKLGMRYRIRISTDRYFEKNVTFEMTSRFRKNQTSGSMIKVPEIVMTLPKGSQALWHQHIFAQVQLYSDVLNVGGKWSETSPDWLLTSDCDREGQNTPGGNAKVEDGDNFITMRGISKKTNENRQILNNNLNSVSKWFCMPIPKGGFASPKSSMRTIQPNKGWYRIDDAWNADDTFAQCPWPEDCIGVGSDNYDPKLPTNSSLNGSVSWCRKGSTGPLCAVCDKGWTRHGKMCYQCSDGGTYMRLVLGFVIVGTPFFVMATFGEKVRDFCE